jgi:hypothetical protein
VQSAHPAEQKHIHMHLHPSESRERHGATAVTCVEDDLVPMSCLQVRELAGPKVWARREQDLIVKTRFACADDVQQVLRRCLGMDV